MKYVKIGILPLLLIIAFFSLYQWNESEGENIISSKEPAVYNGSVDSAPTIAYTQRIGLNPSYWTTYGAEQYMRNIVMNPGFEGTIHRILVIVENVDGNSFFDGGGLGQPDGFWKGAAYDIRSGASAGMKGTIADSKNSGAGGLPQYFPEGEMPQLAKKDVVILTKESDPNPVDMWWIPEESKDLVKIDTTHPRPGSKGKNTLMFSPEQNKPATLNFYADTLSDKFGKLLDCKGKWRLSFWIRSEGQAQVNCRFGRIGSPAFLTKTVIPTNEWQKIEVDFMPQDNAKEGNLHFTVYVEGGDAKVYLDDVFLGEMANGDRATAWRKDVVDMIKALRPSYIRDWQVQNGDTAKNRWASDFERKVCNVRTFGGNGQPSFFYSIPDVLDLCKEVQANPWLIVPTTLGDEELTAFGKYLADYANQSKFSEVIIEFGNENWNWIFRQQAIPYPEAHGPVAERAFKLITEAAGPQVKLRKVVNGQYVNPWLSNQYLSGVPSADTLAVAPYFFNSMKKGSSDEENINALFSQEDFFKQINQDLKKSNKNLAIYEVNLHTLSGSATTPERLRFVGGAVSGAALAKHLLTNMFNKASPQCVFCLAQIMSGTWETKGEVPLWGIVRDVSTTKRFRPTGLAMKMLNEVIGGSLHKIKVEESSSDAEKLTLAAFRSDGKWSAALVSANGKPVTVAVQFPDDQRSIPSYAKVLDATSPFDNNEVNEDVKIGKKEVKITGRTVSITLPAYGFAILKGDGEEVNPVALEPEIIHDR